MRFIVLLMALALAACGGDDKNDKPETLYLNGFWEGQFGTQEHFKMLVYNSEVYAFDNERGYYGTVVYNDNRQAADFSLNSYLLSTDSDSERIAEGKFSHYQLNAFYHFDRTPAQLIGDARTDAKTNVFELVHELGWNQAADLASLSGQWSSNEYSLFINPERNGKLEFKAIDKQEAASGCNFSGNFKLINSSTPLYLVELSERKNCLSFNTKARGYAAINQEQELEIYLSSGSRLMLTTFSAANPSSGSNDAPDIDDEQPEEQPEE